MSNPSRLRGNRNLSLLTHTHLKDALRKMASAGKAAPRAELKIIGRDGEEVEVGQIGEIMPVGLKS